MPEVILPCPACGSSDCECLVCTINADESQTIHFHMACNKCFTSGPIADDAESAKKLWDSMPRALRWTHEPPKVAGWYWHIGTNMGIYSNIPGIITVYVKNGDVGYLNNGEFCAKFEADDQWAGPIPAPTEP